MWIHEPFWHEILWDPRRETVISKFRLLAETQLLKKVGQQGRS
jgi:hypothetical protein